MLILLLVLLASAICLAPVTLRAALSAGQTGMLKVTLSLPCFSRSQTYEIVRTPQGHRLFSRDKMGAGHILTPDLFHGRQAAYFSTVFRSMAALRHFLIRHITCEELSLSVHLHADDAARTAVYTGLARMAASVLPLSWRRQIRLRIQPDFLRSHTSLYARGILRVRLGILLLTGAAMLALAAKQRILNMLKEESAYGASHR